MDPPDSFFKPKRRRSYLRISHFFTVNTEKTVASDSDYRSFNCMYLFPCRYSHSGFSSAVLFGYGFFEYSKKRRFGCRDGETKLRTTQ